MRNALTNILALAAIAAGLAFAVPAAAQAAQDPQDAVHLAGEPDAARQLHVSSPSASDKLTGGQLKIEAHAGGPGRAGVRGARRDAQEGDRRRALRVAYYWVGKNKAATLFSGDARPARSAWTTSTSWAGCTRAAASSCAGSSTRRSSSSTCIAFPILPSGPQAFGWFKRPIKNLADFKGMKCRQTGIVAEIYQSMGMQTVNMPGGEIVPVRAARRDRLRRVGRRRRGPAPRPATSVEVPLHAGHARERHRSASCSSTATCGRASPPQQQEIDQVGRHRDLPALVGEVAEAERRRDRGDAHEARRADPAHPARHPDRVPEDLGRDRRRRSRRRTRSSRRCSTRSAPTPSKVVPAKRFMFPPYSFAANYYLPEKAARHAAAKKQ